MWQPCPTSEHEPRNKGTSKRSPSNPCGEEGYPSVFLGNTLACRTLIILMIIHALNGFWLLEQPRGSMMELLPVFQAFMAKISTWRHSINMENFGAPSQKPTWLYSGLSSETEFSQEMLENRTIQLGQVPARVFGSLCCEDLNISCWIHLPF